jgi:predicted nucleic acid-binding Zn ribbon protein
MPGEIMPTYNYECECGYEFEQLWLSMQEATVHIHAFKCPVEGCELMAQRTLAGHAPAAKFVGHFPGKRIKEVDARKSRQAARIEAKIKSGEMTKQQANDVAKMRDKYAKASPYMTDVKKLKEGQSEADKRKREESQKSFHHELEM